MLLDLDSPWAIVARAVFRRAVSGVEEVARPAAQSFVDDLAREMWSAERARLNPEGAPWSALTEFDRERWRERARDVLRIFVVRATKLRL